MWSVFRHKKIERCDEVREALSSYLDGRLSSRNGEFVERHLEECRSCREDFDSLRETVNLLHNLPLVRVPRPFIIPEAREIPDYVGAPNVRAMPHPMLFGALRTATAVAAIFLVVIFAVDMAYPPPGVAPTVDQYPGAGSEMGQPVAPTPLPTYDVSVPASGAVGEGGEIMTESAPAEGGTLAQMNRGIPWLTHSLEMGLLGVVVILAGFTMVLWRRRNAEP
jgi:hypothetical protein